MYTYRVTSVSSKLRYEAESLIEITVAIHFENAIIRIHTYLCFSLIKFLWFRGGYETIIYVLSTDV